MPQAYCISPIYDLLITRLCNSSQFLLSIYNSSLPDVDNHLPSIAMQNFLSPEKKYNYTLKSCAKHTRKDEIRFLHREIKYELLIKFSQNSDHFCKLILQNALPLQTTKIRSKTNLKYRHVLSTCCSIY